MFEQRKDYLSWDEYFMGIALMSAARSKDPSTQTGACIVKDNKIIGVGYNGAPNGMDDDTFPWASIGEQTGNLLEIKNSYVVHAELNAILNSIDNLNGATLYVTFFPCNECAKAIAQSGIKEVIYLRMYSNPVVCEITKRILNSAGVAYKPYNEDKDFIKEEVCDGIESIQESVKSFSKTKSLIKIRKP
jgi:dCMP deaminase